MLLKYNFIPLLILRNALIVDSKTDFLFHDNGSRTITLNDLMFGHAHKTLNILFYGYKSTQDYFDILRSIVNTVDNGALIIQLLMLVLIFLKGISISNDQIWILIDSQRIYIMCIQNILIYFFVI